MTYDYALFSLQEIMAAANAKESVTTASNYQNGLPSEQENATKILHSFEVPYDCLLCGLQHVGPEFGPLCCVCHDFLYPNGIRFAITNYRAKAPVPEPMKVNEDLTPSEIAARSKLPYLSLYEKVREPYLIANRIARELFLHVIKDDLVENLPSEILQVIFSFLDVISLFMVSRVCRRWQQLVGNRGQWKDFIFKLWPLLQPATPSKGWQNLYVQLLQSMTCLRCFEQGFTNVPFPQEELRRLVEIQNEEKQQLELQAANASCALGQFEKAHQPTFVIITPNTNEKNRKCRAKAEIKKMLIDPIDGIRAVPLDNSYYYWHGSITGPAESPYEGGLFFLLIEVSYNFPFWPPAVKFLTRIFHPNISHHGDIGIDLLFHNWTPSLTISKVLLIINSLLMDPYCDVSMEPEVSRLYLEDRDAFNMIAREWTNRYAMFHVQDRNNTN